MKAFIVAGLLSLLAGCAGGEIVIVDPPYPAPPGTRPNIPPGHMPPPGQCRIWYPERPPGQQPPPGDCEELRYDVPPGAWLLRG
jgi:hypothetical protein